MELAVDLAHTTCALSRTLVVEAFLETFFEVTHDDSITTVEVTCYIGVQVSSLHNERAIAFVTTQRKGVCAVRVNA